MPRAKTQTPEGLKAYQAKYRAEHRDKAVEYAKEYYRGNPNKFNGLGGWTRHLKHWYDMSLRQWDDRIIGQAGECAICGDQMYKPHVDHDHTKPKGEGNRGLLCNECNHLLSNAKEKPEILRAAIKYLAKYKE